MCTFATQCNANSSVRTSKNTRLGNGTRWDEPGTVSCWYTCVNWTPDTDNRPSPLPWISAAVRRRLPELAYVGPSTHHSYTTRTRSIHPARWSYASTIHTWTYRHYTSLALPVADWLSSTIYVVWRAIQITVIGVWVWWFKNMCITVIIWCNTDYYLVLCNDFTGRYLWLQNEVNY